MYIKMFNFWYFLFLVLCFGSTIGLYFLLRGKSEKTKKIVLFSILAFALILHFLKFLYPPYSTDNARFLRDSWFVNISGANIALFPFMFLSKSKKAKDYMFYIGLISGVASILFPQEPMLKTNQSAEWIDIVRFYIHHNIIWSVPFLMVVLKLHKLSYKRAIFVPMYLLLIMSFVMLNQILQSELGFIPLRGEDMFNINYKNSSMIWGPNGTIGDFLAVLCPDFFKTIPVGEYAGQEKFWPLLWLLCPAFILVTPVVFLISLIFDYKNFVADFKMLKNIVKSKFKKKYKYEVIG